jgi:selenocysteine lyase/cysteine desulfurase
VPCVDGTQRPYLSFDAATSTGALAGVLEAVEAFVPWYSSVRCGAGYKSQASALAYEGARLAALAFAGRGPDSGDVAVIRQNTTDAISYLARRLGLSRGDVVVTTMAEHHANLLPWARAATCRYVECGQDGTFTAEDIAAAVDRRPAPRLLAITGASHVTGWLPPLPDIIAAAHHRGIPVLVDAAQLAPHRPLPGEADFLAWSGHKMYAPFGTGVLVGPRRVLAAGTGSWPEAPHSSPAGVRRAAPLRSCRRNKAHPT